MVLSNISWVRYLTLFHIAYLELSNQCGYIHCRIRNYFGITIYVFLCDASPQLL